MIVTEAQMAERFEKLTDEELAMLIEGYMLAVGEAQDLFFTSLAIESWEPVDEAMGDVASSFGQVLLLMRIVKARAQVEEEVEE